MNLIRNVSTQTFQRKNLLKQIYSKFDGLDKNSIVYNELANSGHCFLNHFNLFKSRKEEHEEFLKLNIPPTRLLIKPFKIDSKIAINLTQKSCQLEGNALTIDEIYNFGLNEQQFQTKCVENIVIPKYKSKNDVLEAYWHWVALYQSIAEFTNNNKFSMTVNQILCIHKTLMNGFPNSNPGKVRIYPIQVTSYPLAIFPYPREVPTIVDKFCNWVDLESEISHPILFSCDLFLNFCHIHPFHDGNGRISRILANMALLQKGYHPCLLTGVSREHYTKCVYEAQQEGKRYIFYKLIFDSMCLS